jgi:AcrR family transcriptional regulator
VSLLEASRNDDRLLEALLEAVHERSWQALTLDDIARASGVSRMTLHRRGLSKAVLLERLGERLAAEYRKAFWPALVAQGSARDRLELALAALCQVTEDHLGVLLALEDGPRDAVFHEEGDAVLTRDAFTEPLQRLLTDGLQDGSLSVEDVRESATVIFNLIGWTYRHLRVGHRWPPERARRGVVDIAVRGVAAP